MQSKEQRKMNLKWPIQDKVQLGSDDLHMKANVFIAIQITIASQIKTLIRLKWHLSETDKWAQVTLKRRHSIQN